MMSLSEKEKNLIYRTAINDAREILIKRADELLNEHRSTEAIIITEYCQVDRVI